MITTNRKLSREAIEQTITSPVPMSIEEWTFRQELFLFHTKSAPTDWRRTRSWIRSQYRKASPNISDMLPGCPKNEEYFWNFMHRRLILSPYFGNYGKIEGFMFALEGSPAKILIQTSNGGDRWLSIYNRKEISMKKNVPLYDAMSRYLWSVEENLKEACADDFPFFAAPGLAGGHGQPRLLQSETLNEK